jgi:K319L-like, PKD domain
MSLLVSSVSWSTGDSYSQLPDPHGVKIMIPSKGQEVPINIEDLSVKGASTDNSTTDCKVSLLLNGITPYIEASPTGEGGANDFSDWEAILDASHLNTGENKLSAKLLCIDDKNNQITKYHSINFTGTADLTNSPQGENLTQIDNAESTEDESALPVFETGNTLTSKERISPNAESTEDESALPVSETGNTLKSEDHIDGDISYGPVIIPPSEGKADSLSDSDSVLIPNATGSGLGTLYNNGTLMQETSNESKDVPQINSLIGNGSASNNDTSKSVIIPLSDNGSSESSQINSLSDDAPSSNEPEAEVEQSTGVEEGNNIPMILPTPSPRVTSLKESKADSSVDSPVQELSATTDVENNVLNLGSNTSSSEINLNLSEPTSELTISNSSGNENVTSVRAVAGIDQIINEGMQVILTGDAAYTNDSQLSYEWRQVGGDLKVFLGQQNAKEISFWAPDVDEDSKLTFRFIVLADGTQISSDDVDVIIKDTNNNDNYDNEDDD